MRPRSCTPMIPTIRSRSSTVANSIVILPLLRPRSTFTRVSKRSDSRSARSTSAGACGFARRLAARRLGRPVGDRQRHQLLGRPHRQPLRHDPSARGPPAPGRRRGRAAPARARPTEHPPRPAAARRAGRFSSRIVLEICGRLRPIRRASSSCVAPNSSSSCWYAAASSSGFRLARWMFSSSASRSIASSRVSRTIAGMVVAPDGLGGPPATLAHDELVLAAPRSRAPRSAGGSRPPGSRS